MRRFGITGTASGCGKTTFGRALADRLGVPFVEMDSIVHGPGWVEITDDELRARMEPLLAGEGWVVDGGYQRKIGTMVLDAADTVVWLDLPVRVWLPRLLRRTLVRVVRGDELWNGNRESVRLLFSRESVIWYAIRNHRRQQREWEQKWSRRYPVVRLRTPKEVGQWLETSS